MRLEGLMSKLAGARVISGTPANYFQGEHDPVIFSFE